MTPIERIEAATGPDRELDCLIAAEIGLHIDGCRHSISEMLTMFGIGSLVETSMSNNSVLKTIPSYTVSIDAALTLLPEGWAIDRLNMWPGAPSCCDVVGTHDHNGGRWHNFSDGEARGKAATPALALCAAALRAREVANG
ncbi:hypothetical protein GTZ99_12285 [Novosphingobium sp. FSY-8]|uniref:Phage ABA sandwich domain-containing protein n=1 Tax=Novosphingobium ovatum TaxID=1908523 RepID=A0ABW9XFR5_9SPHN|nr:hypothetical protein [Novosphingobium ovatum]NBC37328.1 hypothetical protein [Novosphingobium ovatum]